MTSCNSCIHCGFCDVFYSEGAEGCSSFKHKTEEEMTMKIMLDEGAVMPVRSHPWDAGLDLFSLEDGYIRCNQNRVFNTGVHVAIPEGFYGEIRSRSGMMCNHGITTDGTIDAHYTGPIKVCLFNHGGSKYEVKAGDKIAQLVILPCLMPRLELVDSLEETDRGSDGFGSTGR